LGAWARGIGHALAAMAARPPLVATF
jgi:hypothetical protein